MAADALRRILARHVRSRPLFELDALCPYAREFASGACRGDFFETSWWRGQTLKGAIGSSHVANNRVSTLQIPRSLLKHTQQRSLHVSLMQYGAAKPTKESTAGEKQKQGQDSIVYSEEEAGDLSDKVAPVSRPEAAGWSFVILAAYGITAFLVYTVYTSIIVEAPEDKVFNQALEAVRSDFRVTSLLGSTIKGYGGAGAGRRGRQRIAHDTYTDSSNVQHTQVQFLVAGNGKRGVVSADMYMRDGEWHYSYLFVDIEGDRFVLKPMGSSFAPR